jgi:hypothetical protein
MTTKAKQPKKRYAPRADRDVASKMARHLRNHIGLSEWDPAVWLLEFFAKQGTFESSEKEKAWTKRNAVVQRRYPELRDGGDSYEVAVEKLAEELDCSESTIRGLVPHYSKDGRPNLK